MGVLDVILKDIGMDELIIRILDIFGSAVFAATGAVRAVKGRLDMLGVLVLACTVGVGGGIIRDTIIGATPVGALNDTWYLAICLVVGMIVFFQASILKNHTRMIQVFDALGLGVFTFIGANKAYEYGIPPIGIVLCGVMTATAGGVIRDVMMSEIPVTLRSDFYATASLFGGVIYLVLKTFTPLPLFTIFCIVALFVSGLRLLAIHYKIQLPKAEPME